MLNRGSWVPAGHALSSQVGGFASDDFQTRLWQKYVRRREACSFTQQQCRLRGVKPNRSSSLSEPFSLKGSQSKAHVGLSYGTRCAPAAVDEDAELRLCSYHNIANFLPCSGRGLRAWYERLCLHRPNEAWRLVYGALLQWYLPRC